MTNNIQSFQKTLFDFMSLVTLSRIQIKSLNTQVSSTICILDSKTVNH